MAGHTTWPLCGTGQRRAHYCRLPANPQRLCPTRGLYVPILPQCVWRAAARHTERPVGCGCMQRVLDVVTPPSQDGDSRCIALAVGRDCVTFISVVQPGEGLDDASGGDSDADAPEVGYPALDYGPLARNVSTNRVSAGCRGCARCPRRAWRHAGVHVCGVRGRNHGSSWLLRRKHLRVPRCAGCFAAHRVRWWADTRAFRPKMVYWSTWLHLQGAQACCRHCRCLLCGRMAMYVVHARHRTRPVPRLPRCSPRSLPELATAVVHG